MSFELVNLEGYNVSNVTLSRISLFKEYYKGNKTRAFIEAQCCTVSSPLGRNEHSPVLNFKCFMVEFYFTIDTNHSSSKKIGLFI